jgi:hypothetical protein
MSKFVPKNGIIIIIIALQKATSMLEIISVRKRDNIFTTLASKSSFY